MEDGRDQKIHRRGKSSLKRKASFKTSGDRKKLDTAKWFLETNFKVNVLYALKLQDLEEFNSICDSYLSSMSKGCKENAENVLHNLPLSTRHRVCGHTFSTDEIAFSCKTCRTDASCVICKKCFTNSVHTGHNVHFQRTTAGGCCDCGDPDAWKRSGFCTSHVGRDQVQTLDKETAVALLPVGLGHAAPVVIGQAVQYIFDTIVHLEESFAIIDLLQKYEEKAKWVWKNSTVDVDAAECVLKEGDDVGLLHIELEEPVHSCSQHFIVKLCLDDNHTSIQTSTALANIAKFSQIDVLRALKLLSSTGECEVIAGSMLQCIPVALAFHKLEFRVALAPRWLAHREKISNKLLQWLHHICSKSDGLARLVSVNMRQQSAYSKTYFDIPKVDSGNYDLSKLCNRHFGASFISRLDISYYTFNLWTGKCLVNGTQTKVYIGYANRRTRKKAKESNAARENFIKNTSKFGLIVDSLSSYISDEDDAHFLLQYAQKFLNIPSKNSPKKDLKQSALSVLVKNCCTLPRPLNQSACKLFHELILDAEYKNDLMACFLASYRKNSLAIAVGMTVPTESIFEFSIQLFSVSALVKKFSVDSENSSENICSIILDSLHEILSLAVTTKQNTELGIQEQVFLPENPVILRQGRYRYCIDNLENVLNVAGITTNIMASNSNLKKWLKVLYVFHNSDKQVRRGSNEQHVEYESDSWISMFNLGIRIHSLFSIICKGIEEPRIIRDRGTTPPLELVMQSIHRNHCREATTQQHHVVSFQHLLTNKSKELYYRCSKFSVLCHPTSFHIPLHRFYSAVAKCLMFVTNRNTCPSATDSFRNDFFGMNDGVDSEERKICFVEFPIRSLVLASQIRSNLWRRNGEENMMAQLYNYTSLPFCVQFQDADRFLLQLGVGWLGADQVISMLLDRFQLGQFFIYNNGELKTHERSSIAARFNIELQHEIGTDSQRLMQMIEEFLCLLIHIGIDLPHSTGDEHRNQTLRSELLHQLCANNHTFSELCDVAILPGDQEEVPAEELQQALDSISTYKEPNGLEPGRFELREEMIAEYNPYFPHLSREEHQLAREKWINFRLKVKQKISPNEVVSPLMQLKTPIPVLRSVRTILTSPIVVGIARVILSRFLFKNLEFSDTTEAVLTCAIHLLVYGVYTVKDVDVVLTANIDVAQFFYAIAHEVSRDFREGCNKPQIPLMEVLMLVLKKCQLAREQKSTIEWLVEELNIQSPDCSAVISKVRNAETKQKDQSANTTSAVLANHDADRKLNRRKLAKERAMAYMAKQSASFMDTLPADEVDSNKVTGKSQQQSLTNATSSTSCVSCILCHEDTRQNELGYCSYVQHSSVLSSAFRPPPKVALDLSLGDKMRSDIQVQLRNLEYFMALTEDDIECIRAGPSADFFDWAQDDDTSTYVGNLDSDVASLTDSTNNALDDVASVELQDEASSELPSNLHLDSHDLSQITASFPSAAELGGTINRSEQRRFNFGHDLIANDPGTTFPIVEQAAYDSIFGQGQWERGATYDGIIQPSYTGPPETSNRSTEVGYPVLVAPVGVHVRTCQHAVHVGCLERYTTSLIEKSERREEFDGSQAIDFDSYMTQFLCPLCKTLSNLLLPSSECIESSFYSPHTFNSSSSLNSRIGWNALYEREFRMQCWFRKLFTPLEFTTSQRKTHSYWRDYLEDTLWECHGNIEKSVPFLWSACSFTISTTIVTSISNGELDPKLPVCNIDFSRMGFIAREAESIRTIIQLCRWSIVLFESNSDSNTIYEVAKRCCPLFVPSSREQRKFDKLLEYADLCLSGILLGLVTADSFTCFVVSCVFAEDLTSSLDDLIAVFYVVEVVRAIQEEVFEINEEPLVLKFKTSGISRMRSSSSVKRKVNVKTASSVRKSEGSHANDQGSETRAKQFCTHVNNLLENMQDDEKNSEKRGVWTIIKQFTMRLPKFSVKIGAHQLQCESLIDVAYAKANDLYRKMMLFRYCLADDGKFSQVEAPECPRISDIVKSGSEETIKQIMSYIIGRTTSEIICDRKAILNVCPHGGGVRNGYIANIFRVPALSKSSAELPLLVQLPQQYDILYSQYVDLKCKSCSSVPPEPGLCLICGALVCCNCDCCRKTFPGSGLVTLGECTRHAMECGAGVGIVLMLLQCRILLVSSSMSAYFPCPYVDAHGEEDHGLQRGRPLRLSEKRFQHLQTLWQNNRICAEVSRLRNHLEPQEVIAPGSM